jgi:hypothetical protein
VPAKDVLAIVVHKEGGSRAMDLIELSLFCIVLPTLRGPLEERVAFQHFSEVLAPSMLVPRREMVLS